MRGRAAPTACWQKLLYPPARAADRARKSSAYLVEASPAWRWAATRSSRSATTSSARTRSGVALHRPARRLHPRRSGDRHLQPATASPWRSPECACSITDRSEDSAHEDYWLSAAAGASTPSSKSCAKIPTSPNIYALPGNGGHRRGRGLRADRGHGYRRHRALCAWKTALILPSLRRTIRWRWARWTRCTARGHPLLRPRTKAAASIEGSKVFAKNLMKKYGIPTAAL